MRCCRSAWAELPRPPEELLLEAGEFSGRSERSLGRFSAPMCRGEDCRPARSSREASLARLPTRWSAGLLPISANRWAARWVVRSAARWCAARSADCCDARILRSSLRHDVPLAFGKVRVLRYPSLRAPLDILFLVCCIALTADVLVPEIWGHGKTKDYPLWFWAGQQVLQGKDLYPGDPKAYFEFIYPPLSAVLLAIPSAFGKIPLYICLSLFNAVAWWMTAQFSNAMTGSGRIPGPWLFALPSIVTISSVFDMFDLGHP